MLCNVFVKNVVRRKNNLSKTKCKLSVSQKQNTQYLTIQNDVNNYSFKLNNQTIREFHKSASVNTGLDKYGNHVDSEDNNVNTPFEFTEENYKKIQQIITKYPPNYAASAIAPALDIAQRQNGGWLTLSAMNKVAKIVDVHPMSVYEVATFYTMFNRTPIGKNFIQLCGTVPCHLVGAPEIMTALKKRLGIKSGETTPDKKFTLLEVECLGACVNAPMMQINDDYYEDLTVETTLKIIDDLANGKTPTPGPQHGKRKVAAPAGGKTTLKEEPLGPYAPYLEKLDAAAKTQQATAAK